MSLRHYVEIWVAPDYGVNEFRRLYTSKLRWPHREQAVHHAEKFRLHFYDRFDITMDTWLAPDDGEHFGISDQGVIVDIRIISTTEESP